MADTKRGDREISTPPLWSHQLEAIQFGLERQGFGLFMDMGTGKSRVIIELIKARGCGKTLIVCPPSVIASWVAQFQTHSPATFRVVPLVPGTTATQKAEIVRDTYKLQGPVVYIVNYESVWRDPLKEWWKHIKLDMVVADEAQYLRSPNSKVSKFFGFLGNWAKWRVAATGTPLANSPLNVYGIYRFLDKSIFGTRYDRFRDFYSTSITYGNARIITGYLREEDLHERMYRIAFRVNKEDVLDLPPEVDEDQYVFLRPDNQRMHDRIKKEAIAELEDHSFVVPTTVLDKMNKCLQICNGAVFNDEHVLTEVGKEKEEALYELLAGIDEPVVVFGQYRHDFVTIARVAKKLNKKYAELSGRSYGLGEGSTYPLGVDILGVQLQAGAFGIDLSRSRYGIYFTHPLDLGIYSQSRSRLLRPGQQGHKVVFIHLVAFNTVDQKIYEALQKKRDIVNYITDVLLDANPTQPRQFQDQQ